MFVNHVVDPRPPHRVKTLDDEMNLCNSGRGLNRINWRVHLLRTRQVDMENTQTMAELKRH